MHATTWLGMLTTLLLIPVALYSAEPASLEWQKLAPLPDKLGVAAPFAGVLNGALIVAGGANFPAQPPWEGGKKVWHDRIWRLASATGNWEEVGKLPRPLGYGVSITTADGILCLGGSDAEQHYAETFLLAWRENKIHIKPFPALPKPIANACGALLDNTIYLAGGLETPNSTQALKTCFALDLSAADLHWRELPAWPGEGRMLAVAAVQSGAFYVISGASLSANAQGQPTRKYLTDAYLYQPRKGWERIADLPRAVVAAPSPALTPEADSIVILGGDDGTQLQAKPQQHVGFTKQLLSYSLTHNCWENTGTMPASRVTVPAVRWGEEWILPSGEMRPGVRSPEIWKIQRAAK